MSAPQMPSSSHLPTTFGRVWLIGAGPGDPGLITHRGRELLSQCDCVIYDALANPKLLAIAPSTAEKICVGKRANRHSFTQDKINELLVTKAQTYQKVVRLKGGDPFIFGRGSEEVLYLTQRDIQVEVVPGIPAALAAATYAGIPLTHRHVATSVVFITGHEDPTKTTPQIHYDSLVQLCRDGATLCFYMGMKRIGPITTELLQKGLSPETPAAVVRWGTLHQQETLTATLGDLAEQVTQQKLKAPAMIYIGPTIGLDPSLSWFTNRPLFGQTFLLTRTRQQSSQLRQLIEARGGQVIEAPTLVINPPDTWDPVDQCLEQISTYDWLILTSTNGVNSLRQRLDHLGYDARHLGGVKIAVVGSATAEALTELGLRADVVPDDFVATALADELIAHHAIEGKRALLLQANIARPALANQLTDHGVHVDQPIAYRTDPAPHLPDEAKQALASGNLDWVLFASSSSARNLVGLLGADRHYLDSLRIATIGPITTESAESLDLTVTCQASPHTMDGLLNAIEQTLASTP